MDVMTAIGYQAVYGEDYEEAYCGRWPLRERIHRLEAVAEAARDYFRAGALTEYSAAIRLGAAVEELDALGKEE